MIIMDRLPEVAIPSDGTNSPSFRRSTVSGLILSSLSRSSYFFPGRNSMIDSGSLDGSTDIRRDTLEEMLTRNLHRLGVQLALV